MKPTKTAHILRKLFKTLGSDARVDAEGFLPAKLPFPRISGNASAFALKYLEYNVARKRKTKKATTLQMRNALGKWSDSEWRNRVVNDHGWWVMPVDAGDRAMMSKLKQRAMAHISRILTDVWPDYGFDPTSGATATTSRKLSFACSKIDGTPLEQETPEPHKCSNAAKHHLEEMFRAEPGVARRYFAARHRLVNEELVDFEINRDLPDLVNWLCENVPFGVLDYVSKDIETVRLIILSNSLSIMVQKTFGAAIRKALRAEGIDLDDQTINQEWAEIGSLTGIVATVDLSAASDSIALRHLSWFPTRWQQWLLSCRDTFVQAGSVQHELQMVAGMGNGYIFELESLLFYAMTRAVVDELGLDASQVSVYGDDIICPARAYTLLEQFFLFAGFLVNKEKSYATGPFRESCGKHYYNGVDVSPFFIRGDADELADLYHIYNGLSEWQHRTGVCIQEAIDYVGGLIPFKDRHLVPDSWGSRSGIKWPITGLLVPERKWSKRYQRCFYTWEVLVEGSRDVTDRLPDQMQLAAWLLAAERRVVVLPKSALVKACSPLVFATVHAIGGFEDIFEPAAASATWSSTTERRQHLSVSSEGDA